MGSVRDHKENERFRDHSQEGDASMSDMGTVANGSLPAQHSWEEWLERTSREQILILRENNRKKASRTRRKRKLLRISRFVLPSAVAAIVIFLCAVPTGRALANAAIQNITELIDRYFYLQSADGSGSSTDGELPAALPAVPDGFNKIKEVSQRVRGPLLYIGKEGLVVSDVKVRTDNAATTVQIEYRTSEGDSIVTYQREYVDQIVWGATMDADGNDPQTHVLVNGETLYCTYTQEGHAYGNAHWGDTAFFISSPTLKWERLLEAVDALACVQ